MIQFSCPQCKTVLQSAAAGITIACPKCRFQMRVPGAAASAPSTARVKGIDDKFCDSCGEIIKLAAEVCPKCGVRQKAASGITAFFTKTVGAIKNKINAAQQAIQDEQNRVTGISPTRKNIAIVVALSAGWTGVTGLGSIIADRPKAGYAMLGIPLFLGVMTALCLFATFFSLIASIFWIGIPFLFFFGGLLMALMPLFVSTFIGFYVADVVMCINAK